MRQYIAILLALLVSACAPIPAATPDASKDVDAAGASTGSSVPTPGGTWASTYGTYAAVASAVVAGISAILAFLSASGAQRLAALAAIATAHEKFWSDASVARARRRLVVSSEYQALKDIIRVRIDERNASGSNKQEASESQYQTARVSGERYEQIDDLDQLLGVLHRILTVRSWMNERRPLAPGSWVRPRLPNDGLFEYWLKKIHEGPYEEVRRYAECFFSELYSGAKWGEPAKEEPAKKTLASPT